MRILISGAGIAGSTLAYWLAHYGFSPTLTEKSPIPRTGGYMVDFWGLGFDVAERMGLLPDIMAKGYDIKEVRLLNGRGSNIGSFSTEALKDIAKGRYLNILRGDLADSIWRKVPKEVETIYGDEICRVDQKDDSVQVGFKSGRSQDFDLLIGADGIHSEVRELVFGAKTQFEKYLGYIAAAFEVTNYRPRDEDVCIMCTESDRQVSRFSLRQDRTMFLFLYVDNENFEPSSRNLDAYKRILRDRFGTLSWECPQILEAMESCQEIHLDRVSQIRMEQWTRGRVALVGDAACSTSLFAGQGTAIAMAGAYILAGELNLSKGDYQQAFANYTKLLKPFIAKKEQAGERNTGAFAPRTALGFTFRNNIAELLNLPLVAQIAFARAMRDSPGLPQY